MDTTPTDLKFPQVSPSDTSRTMIEEETEKTEQSTCQDRLQAADDQGQDLWPGTTFSQSQTNGESRNHAPSSVLESSGAADEQNLSANDGQPRDAPRPEHPNNAHSTAGGDADSNVKEEVQRADDRTAATPPTTTTLRPPPPPSQPQPALRRRDIIQIPIGEWRLTLLTPPRACEPVWNARQIVLYVFSLAIVGYLAGRVAYAILWRVGAVFALVWCQDDSHWHQV